MASERIKWLDVLKGVAMSLVILGHIAQKYYVWDIYPAKTPIIKMLFDIIYSFHMPLFMIISGFLFYHSYVNNGEVIRCKFSEQVLNLLFLYIIFSCFEGAVKIFFSQDVITKVKPVDLLMIIVKPLGGRLWYLYVLLEYYILFSSRTVLSYLDRPIFLFVFLAVSILNVVTDYSWPFAVRQFMRNLFPFYIGILLCKKRIAHKKQGKNYIKVFIMATAICVTVLRVILWGCGNYNNDIPIISLLFGVIVGMGFFKLFEYCLIFSNLKCLKKIGLISLELYILHEYPLVLCIKITKLFIKDDWILAILLCYFFTVSMITILTLLMKRTFLHSAIFKPFSYIKIFLNSIIDVDKKEGKI